MTAAERETGVDCAPCPRRTCTATPRPEDPLLAGCSEHPCEEPGDVVMVTFNGWVVDVCHRHARELVDAGGWPE